VEENEDYENVKNEEEEEDEEEDVVEEEHGTEQQPKGPAEAPPTLH
jgi:hypothetical protein